MTTRTLPEERVPMNIGDLRIEAGLEQATDNARATDVDKRPLTVLDSRQVTQLFGDLLDLLDFLWSVIVVYESHQLLDIGSRLLPGRTAVRWGRLFRLFIVAE